ncbi:MAG: hypothetical protein WBI29_02130 [Candidatus Saccharimonadales bacterium]
MNIIKKFFLSLLILASFFIILPTNVGATAGSLDIYLFWGEGCPHCAKEKIFLADLIKEKPEIKLHDFEIYYNFENAKLMQEVSNTLKADAAGVPFLVIGDKGIVGFGEGITETEIEERVDYCLENKCEDYVAPLLADSQTNQKLDSDNLSNTKKDEKIIKLPIIGEIDALDFSLPILSIFMGAVDGFNPCAMWTLLFLISLLLGLKDRRRMWTLGVAFIVASAFVYFLFMAAWLQIILFLGFIVWVRAAIGLLALAGGGYNIRGYLKHKDIDGCEVTGTEKRQLVFAKLRKIAQQNSLWLALGGIIILAFAVNLVELVCSAGLPAVFTQVLSLNNLATWQYYAYILLYIFFFMIDDIIIFAIAMFTLKLTGISTKYGKWSKLIGGLLMIIIGLLLIFKPELLMFG